MRIKFFSLLVVCVAILLAACGRNNETHERETNVEMVQNENDGLNLDENNIADETTLTLTILAPTLYTAVIGEAERRMVQSFSENGIDFSIELTDYGQDESDGHRTRLQTLLMAGHGYDVIFWDRHNVRNYAASGFLTDIYTLIDNHPTTTRDDFFTNVLEAYEIDGGLFSFPITFGFEYVGINASLPQSILERFVGRDSITVHEILRMYSDLRQNYFEEFGHYVFTIPSTHGGFFDLASIPIADYIDFENNTANLNQESFVTFLEHFYEAFRGYSIFDSRGWFGHEPHYDWLMELAEDHAFIGVNSNRDTLLAVMEQIEPLFLNFIPIANDNGELLINPRLLLGHPNFGGAFGSTLAKVMFPAAGNGQLAWEFVQYLIPAMLNHFSPRPGTPAFRSFGVDSLVSPINKADFDSHINRALTGALGRPHDLVPFVGIHDGGVRRDAIRNATAVLAEINERPVAIMEGHNIPVGILTDTLNSLLLGTSTPQATAQELHNRISLWLIE
jgi:hypothetical protein